MNHMSWPWRKRLSQKRIGCPKPNAPVREHYDEMHSSRNDLDLETMLESLNEKLESVIHENEAKDDLLSSYAEKIQEATEVREKAEKEATSLRQELDKALEQQIVSNERLTQLNTALKESLQQLSSIREERDQRLREVVMKTSKEFEKGQKRLEEKLTEKSKSLANLILENAHLNKALVVNENLIEDLSKRKYEAEMGVNTIMARLDLLEKENAFLKYEFRLLEKELDIRSEESEFHRQAADVSRRQHTESIKKITKLENECQRLRGLVRKRFPGPVAIAKMKDNTTRNSHEISEKKISVLIDQLCNLEGENRTLKGIIAKKDYELHSSLSLCAKSTSDFSELEAQLDELSKGKKNSMEMVRFNPTSKELSPKSETESRNFGVSGLSLMDDFVEMEKLAIVSVNENHIAKSFDELISVRQNPSTDNWLQNVLKLILDQNHVSKTSFDDLLEDIRFALSYMKGSIANEATINGPVEISGCITWKSPNRSPRKGSLNEGLNIEMPENELAISGTEIDKHEALMNQLRSSEKTIEYLEKEIESLKESKGEVENQIVDQKLINEDLGTQLTVSKGKLNKVIQKLTALEVELEDKSCCYEELEGTCVELQLLLESVNTDGVSKENKDRIYQDEKGPQTGWEITAASAKLVECQETILSLGKQLQALASQNEAPNSNKKLNQRSSLRDQMLAEDNSEPENDGSPKSKEIVIFEGVKKPPVLDIRQDAHMENKSLAIVPRKKQDRGVGFWKKLLLKKKIESNTNTPRLLA